MKIVLSLKGFDSATGQVASPILQSGEPAICSCRPGTTEAIQSPAGFDPQHNPYWCGNVGFWCIGAV